MVKNSFDSIEEYENWLKLVASTKPAPKKTTPKKPEDKK